MIIAKGDFEKTGEVILIGLTKANVKRLMRDQPILRDLRFAGIPYHLTIVFGQDEMDIHRKLRIAGVVTKDTEMKEEGSLDDTPED